MERASPAVATAETAVLRRRLLFPLIVLLLLFAATFVGLALFAGARLNNLAHEQADRLVANVVEDVRAEDRRTVLDYAYWDQLVEHTYRSYDREWSDTNIGWVTREFGARAAYVLDGENRVLHRQAGDDAPLTEYGAALQPLLERARKPYDTRPEPVDAFLWRGRQVDLVSISALGADTGAEDLAREPGPVLVLARAVDAALLARMAKGAGVGDPHVARLPASTGGATALPGADENTIAWLHWSPPRPARQALRPLALPVAGLLTLLALVTVAYILAVRRVTGRVDTALRDLEATNIRLTESERQAVAARYQAEEANRAKTMFLANVSHELRTPLNAIIGFADLILVGGRRPSSEERKREYVGDIRASGHHLLALINMLIDLSRIEAGHRVIDLAPEAVLPVLNGVLRRLRPLAEQRSVTLVSRTAGLVNPDVLSEPLALDQMLTNIIGNAIKFTTVGSDVEVLLEERADTLVIAVMDRGPGLDDELRGRMFEPFTRGVGADVRSAEGAGLGLSIVQALVRRHGGSIDLTNRPGGGLVVSLALPRPA